MARPKNLVNAKFRFLTVKRYLGKDPLGHRIWEAECVCGNTVRRITSNLWSSISCGCVDRRKKEFRTLELPPIILPEEDVPNPELEPQLQEELQPA